MSTISTISASDKERLKKVTELIKELFPYVGKDYRYNLRYSTIDITEIGKTESSLVTADVTFSLKLDTVTQTK